MSAASNLRKDAEELNRLSLLTESANVRRILAAESTKLLQVAESEEKKNPSEAARHHVSVSKLTNYGWDQSEKFLKIYVSYDGVHNYPPNNISVSYTHNSLNVQILDEGKNITRVFAINNLLNPIVKEECSFKIKTDTVLVNLRKVVPERWAYVTQMEKKSKDSKLPKMDNSKDDDPGAGLMSLMKQMYDDGDDDMKRTIAKAWTEARDKKSPDDVI